MIVSEKLLAFLITHPRETDNQAQTENLVPSSLKFLEAMMELSLSLTFYFLTGYRIGATAKSQL